MLQKRPYGTAAKDMNIIRAVIAQYVLFVKEKEDDEEFLFLIAAPARRALLGAGINTLE